MTACTDVVLLPFSTGRWVAYNLFARTALGLDSQAVALLGGDEDVLECRVWKIGWFANLEGTLADPTRFRRREEDWGDALVLDAAAAAKLFNENFLIVDDEAEYRARFARKSSPLDGKHFGNFHDQVGANLLLSRRPASTWWLDQKFVADRLSVRTDNLYGSAQRANLERYFHRSVKPGMRVIDLGCGTGIYSKLISDCGAEVLGVDPSSEYLDIARRNFARAGVTFSQLEIGRPRALDSVESASADMVFMSDALLFYFVKVSQKDTHSLDTLLGDIHRILKPSGVFVSVEPHPCFYLAPWLGSSEHPFTALTEYRNRNFTTTPNFSQSLQALFKGGFVVRWMEEFYADSSVEVDARATGFASEFPMWTLFELTKDRSAG